MPKESSSASNPFSTGGGGVRFENQVQAYFLAIFLSNGHYPCLDLVKKTNYIRLQGRPKFDTDDIVLNVENILGQEVKLLVQIKHKLTFTRSDEDYVKSLKNAWDDFNKPTFNKARDKILFLTGPQSQGVIDDFRPILEFARTAASLEDFEHNAQTSKEKAERLKALKSILEAHVKSAVIVPKDIWLFCRVLHTVSFDLDYTSQSSSRAMALNLLKNAMREDLGDSEAPTKMWSRLLELVSQFNQTGGTLNAETVPAEILVHFGEKRATLEEEYLRRDTDWLSLVLNARKEDWTSARDGEFIYVNNINNSSTYLRLVKCYKKNSNRIFNQTWLRIWSEHDMWSAEVVIFYKGRPVRNVCLAANDRVLSLVPHSTRKLHVDELTFRVASVAANFYGLWFEPAMRGGDTRPKFDVIRQPRLNMDKVKQIIEQRDINKLRKIIELAKLYNDRFWLKYLYLPSQPVVTVGADTQHMAEFAQDYQFGNVINLCLRVVHDEVAEHFDAPMPKKPFYDGLKLLLELCIDEEIDVNQHDYDSGCTPLLLAITNGEPELAMLLVKAKADLTLTTKSSSPKETGLSPLRLAIDQCCFFASKNPEISKQYVELIDLMLSSGADPNYIVHQCSTYRDLPLFKAFCWYSDRDEPTLANTKVNELVRQIMDKLIRAGADIKRFDSDIQEEMKRILDGKTSQPMELARTTSKRLSDENDSATNTSEDNTVPKPPMTKTAKLSTGHSSPSSSLAKSQSTTTAASTVSNSNSHGSSNPVMRSGVTVETTAKILTSQVSAASTPPKHGESKNIIFNTNSNSGSASNPKKPTVPRIILRNPAAAKPNNTGLGT